MISFVRHGQSIYNDCNIKMKNKYGPTFVKFFEYQNYKLSQKLLDGELTEVGKEQAKLSRQIFSVPNIVIVSPMRRALETCEILTKNMQVQIIVQPQFREHIEASCDLGTKLIESMSIFPFDFSQIKNPSTWWIDTISDLQLKEKLIHKLSLVDQSARQNKAVQLTLALIKANWQHKKNNQMSQSVQIYNLSPNYQKQQKILLSYAAKYKHIAVITHSKCIFHFCKRYLNNCQIINYSIQQLKSLKQ